MTGAATLGSSIRVACEARSIEDRLPIVWGDVSSDLNNKRHLDAVIAQLTAEDRGFQIEHGCRLGVVILDTLAACFSLKDENSNAEAAVIIRRAKTLADALGALVVLVHHYGKAQETGLRGASAWRAGADAVLAVQADRNEMSGGISNRQIVLTKSRTHEEGWLRTFSLKHVPIGHDEEGEPIGSCVIADSERDEVVIRGVRPLTGGGKIYHDALCAALDMAGRRGALRLALCRGYLHGRPVGIGPSDR